jgi:ribosomal protein L37AE/L43A
MSDDKNDNMKEFLSDLLEKAKKKDRLDVIRLRDEIKKEVESDEVIRKFVGLLETFRDIIPDERQRYNAAVRALSATAGLSLQNVLDSANNQLEKLKLFEKGVLSALPGLRDDLKDMESRSGEIKDEIASLRQKIAEFEKEEKEVLAKIAVREKEAKLVEGAISKLFTDVGTEIAGIRKKIEEFTSKEAPAAPKTEEAYIESREEDHKDWGKELAEGEEESEDEEAAEGEEESEGEEREGEEEEEEGLQGEFNVEEIPVPQETEFLKKCPMCGGQIHFLVQEQMWKCYTCGHEESSKKEADPAPPASERGRPALSAVIEDPAEAPEKDELTPLAAAQAAPQPSATRAHKSPTKKKACPVCRKQMEWHENKKSWECPHCGYQRRVF